MAATGFRGGVANWQGRPGWQGNWRHGHFRHGHRRPVFALYGGFPYAYDYYPYEYSYYGDDPACYRNVRVKTPRGLRWQRVWVCS